jgi:threonine/homoserine efflux transporter RhtA
MMLLEPVVAIIAGILILAIPRLLNYVIALYLIIIGVIGLLQELGMTPY